MKKIFIMAHSLEIGGAERALLGILENIDTTQYQVDLFLLRHQGELMKYIPDNINLLPENLQYSSLGIPITEVIKRKQIKIAMARYIGKRKAIKRIDELGLTGDNNVINEYSHKYTRNVMPQINQIEYDLAISFMSPHYFVAEKVNAKRKAAWIHTDYSVFQADKESELQMWNKYDDIISISEDVTKGFLKTFPSLEKKIVLIENIMPVKYMKKLANSFGVTEEMPLDGSVRLLTMGRFVYPKKMEEIPAICRKIREMNLNVKWYLIGYGGDEPLIRQKISDNKMEEFVIILGKKENPYPYIKACDIYVQPSRYEGKSIAVREAQIFNKPVAITDYSTAHSQLENEVDGLIVPMDIDKTAEGIVNLIRNKDLQKKIMSNMKQRDYVQQEEIQKIYKLVRN